MPLVYQQNINALTKLGVWHINEPESFFLQRVPLQKNINHPHKRLQHLAGRLLLPELFEDFPCIGNLDQCQRKVLKQFREQ